MPAVTQWLWGRATGGGTAAGGHAGIFGWPLLLGQSVAPGHAVWCGTCVMARCHGEGVHGEAGGLQMASDGLCMGPARGAHGRMRRYCQVVHVGVPVEQHQENHQNHQESLAAQTQTHALPTKSHMTCLQPHIYIRPCTLEGFCFFVNTTSSWLLFAHQHSFIWTIPVDSGSNDFVLDSLRYVSNTDFYTDHLCFTALLPRHLPWRARAPPWTFNHGMGYMGGCPVHW